MHSLVALFSVLAASAHPLASWLFEAPGFPSAASPRVMSMGINVLSLGFKVGERNFTLQFSTNPGTEYRLEATARIDDPTWFRIGSAFIAGGPLLGVNVTPSGAQTFYRLVVVDDADGPNEWTRGLERLIGYGSIAN